MKAIREIGMRKFFLYIIFTLWDFVFRILSFSPLRIFWMRLFGAYVGNNSIVGGIVFMNLYRKGLNGLHIGNNCYVSDRVVFDLADEIIIGNNSTLSEEVFILTHTNVGYKDHPLQKQIPAFCAKVVFKDGCFVGIRSTVMPGVTIGEKSAVGACSLVTKDIAGGELHYGIPASFRKKLE